MPSVQLVGSRGAGINGGAKKKTEREIGLVRKAFLRRTLLIFMISYPIFRVARQLSERLEEAILSSSPVSHIQPSLSVPFSVDFMPSLQFSRDQTRNSSKVYTVISSTLLWLVLLSSLKAVLFLLFHFQF